MATFNTGGKNAHTKLNLRQIAASLLPADQRGPNAVEMALRALVKANPVLRNQTTYLSGHLLNVPKGYEQLNQSQQSAYDLMNDTLRQWGISSLGADLKKLIVSGDTNADTLSLALSQTQAYKQRFSANAARVKAGLSELSPAEYIGLEGQYKQTLAQYGLPKGFYDSKQDTDNWIANDVSPTEMADRAKMASDLVHNSPPEAMKAWNQYYGGGSGGAIAALLDPKRAEPLLQTQFNAAEIGGAAGTQGLSVSKGRAEQFANAGVTIDSARQAYSDIASRLPTDTSLADRFGQTFGQTQEENATLLGTGADRSEQERLYSMESGMFGSHAAGATDGSVGVSGSY